MEIDIYHVSFGDNGGKVATVQIDDPLVGMKSGDSLTIVALEEAYKLTQNIHGSWINNRGVTVSAATKDRGGCRSTSVGDEMVVRGIDGESSRWIVATVGFITPDKIGDDPLIDLHRAENRDLAKTNFETGIRVKL